MAGPKEVPIGAQPIDRFEPLIGKSRFGDARRFVADIQQRLEGRVFWNINSTAAGGGVAEMLRSILPYARGSGIDARWVVIDAPRSFFQITKRLHHALHGSTGDGSPLGKMEKRAFDKVLRANAQGLQAMVRPRDFVLLHDPQTAGLAPDLIRAGAIVIWQCHVGQDEPDEEAERAWSFLEPYLREVSATIFSRDAYVPDCCDSGRSMIIPPSIDPFSAKNQEMDEATVRAILVETGLVEGPPGPGSPVFLREDGSPGRVDRHADVLRLGRAPTWDTPLVVQVSRWDPLKDPVGVLRGFAQLVDGCAPAGAELVLAGPNVTAVADDPEGAVVLDQVFEAWRKLSHPHRNRVHIASLPMADVEENAAIVNALQRHAAVVVQKSLREGFGLTVTEAMWKGRPVVGSAVGGIQDQIEDGVSGLLVKDPTDLNAFGQTVRRLLEDRPYADGLAKAAHRSVEGNYLEMRQLAQYAQLLERVDERAGA
jgi:trehalose synthase